MILTRLTLTTLTLLSSLFSFSAYTLLLKYLGTSRQVDDLFYAASVPLSVAGVTSGVLLYLLPPRLIDLSKRNQDAAIQSLILAVLGAIGAATVFALMMWLDDRLAPFWLIWLAFANTAGVLVLTTLASCTAQARGAYISTGLAPLLSSIGLLVGSIGAVSTQNAWLMVVGQWVGSIAGLWLLLCGLHLRLHRNLARTFKCAWIILAPLRPHAISIALGASAFTLFLPIDAVLCTQLDSGSVSIMSYAQRVLVSVGTAVSLGAYTIATRNSHYILKTCGHAAMHRQVNKEVWRIVIFGLIAWMLYQLGGSRLLAILLSGSTISDEDLSRLLDCVGWMLLGVGPMAAMPYLFRIFYLIGVYIKPAVLGVFTVLLYIAMSWILLGRFQILAMAYAYIAVWWVMLVASLYWFKFTNTDILENNNI